jgi:hypothetical protein
VRFRKLRIAFSILCGVACLLLIALWVRSYLVCDIAYFRAVGKREYQIASLHGFIQFSTQNLRGKSISFIGLPERSFNRETLDGSDRPTRLFYKSGVKVCVFPKFFFSSNPTFGMKFDFPIWFAAILTVVFAAVPWIRWSNQFSVRALLIVTTLVAVVLGLAVYAVRWPAG